LCSTYAGSAITYTVGAGTAYPNSSNLPSATLSNVTLLVQNDFTVNSNLTLNNVIVKVNMNKKILVLGDFFTYNMSNLSLNNTKVFSNACSYMWKGIDMGGLASITVTNNSVIEDADNAISAINSGYVYLNIDNSTFNRNKVGINLDATNLWGFATPAMLQYFVNNKFTCTSALNPNTANIQKTEVGLQIKNVPYPFGWNYGNSWNSFTGLKNGIYIEGTQQFNTDQYTFESIEDKALYCKNGNYLKVDFTRFRDIRLWGIYFEDSKELQATNNFFRAVAYPSITFRRYMIHSVDPKIGNTHQLHANRFENYANDMQCINLERLSLGSQEMTAHMSSNTFLLFTTTAGQGINLRGSYASNSNVLIENNSFNFDGNNTPTSNQGIRILDGNKTNVKIIANSFVAGDGTYCSLEGSTGIGNEFSNNVFFQGQYGRLGLGVAVNNFQNAKICSNTDNLATFKTYAFINQNNNTDFTNNTTYGRATPNNPSLSIGTTLLPSSNNIIGLQIHKGNKWFSQNGTHPWIQHNEPALAILSQFVVHTPQSVLNGSNYTYFSQYFPVQVTPSPVFIPFFTTQSGTPSTSCIAQAPSIAMAMDPVLDPLIAQNRLSDYITNPVILSDAKKHLYRKIKMNSSAFNTQFFKDFIKNNESKNTDKIHNLETIIDESEKISDVIKKKMDVLVKQSEELNKQNASYNATNRPSRDVMKQWYIDRTKLDEDMKALYTQHKEGKKLKHKEAKTILDNIVAVESNDKFTKEVYQIVLDALINQDGKFNQEQIERLKKVAATCVTEAGMIVYVARGFLSQDIMKSIQASLDICEPKFDKVSYIVENQNTNLNNIKSTNPIIFPNPAGEQFTITLPKEVSAKVQISDISGKVINTYDVNSRETTIHHKLQKGIYILNIKTSDGNTSAHKISINY
jgi:hypothetical protein